MLRWHVIAVALFAVGCSSPPEAVTASKSPAPRTSTPTSHSPSPSPPQDITLAFAGDVHFEGRTETRLSRHSDDVLGPIGEVLAAADVSVVNLESAITERGRPENKRYTFRTDAAALTALKAEGVDVVSMANNHAIDFGQTGLRDSLDAIRTTGVPVVGIGANEAAAFAPHVISVRGTRVAILAASQVLDAHLQSSWGAGESKAGVALATNPERLVAAVRAARAKADVVVVYLHWGQEGNRCPTAKMRAIVAQLSAAGATAIVGTHAHTLVGDGWFGQTYVGYGLGNFLWYSDNTHPFGNETGVMTLQVRGHRVGAARLTPAYIVGGVPLPVSASRGSRILSRFAGLRRCTGLRPAPKP